MVEFGSYYLVAQVVKLADTKDSKSFAFGRAGSSPALGTMPTKYKGNFMSTVLAFTIISVTAVVCLLIWIALFFS